MSWIDDHRSAPARRHPAQGHRGLDRVTRLTGRGFQVTIPERADQKAGRARRGRTWLSCRSRTPEGPDGTARTVLS